VLLASSDKALYFSPAEIQFLFSGPFTRRQVLAYKVGLTLLIGLPSSLILCAIIRIQGVWMPALVVGVLLVSMFLQLFSMALALLISALGASLYTRGRKLFLAGVLGLGALLLYQSGALHVGDWGALGERVLDAPAWQVVAAPLGWFFQAMLALGPLELARYASPAGVGGFSL